MPHYTLTLSHADGHPGTATRQRWWADDAGAIDQAYRWLRLHRRINGAQRPRFDRWTVVRPGRLGLPEIIATGGIEDVPATLQPGTSVEVDCRPPKPGSSLAANSRLT